MAPATKAALAKSVENQKIQQERNLRGMKFRGEGLVPFGIGPSIQIELLLIPTKKSKTGNFNPGQDYLPRPKAISLGRSVVIE